LKGNNLRGEQMEVEIYPQCRIVPIQMLNPDNAEKFLDGLSSIAGIRRVLIHGPGYLADIASNNPDSVYSMATTSTNVKILDQDVKMHVLMGDVVVEAVQESVFDTIANYCKEFFEDMPFQILVGSFIKNEPSLADYLKKDIKNKDFIGLSDYKEGVDPVLIKTEEIDRCVAS
jgi:methyl-coenzyme M reductase subunit D